MAKRATKREKDPFELILKGERITITKRTRRGEFKIAFPLPSDLRQIDILVAERLDGKPISSFSESSISNIRAYATLDVIIVSAPKWWEKLDSSEQCPDDDLVRSLYRSYLRHYAKIQKLLSDGRFGKDVGQIDVGEETETVDDGTFQDITHG